MLRIGSEASRNVIDSIFDVPETLIAKFEGLRKILGSKIDFKSSRKNIIKRAFLLKLLAFYE